MEFRRLPRFKRAAAVAPMQLTERDRDIIRLVHRHRFLRSRQIMALMGESSQQLLRRLQILYHHGYLERPRAQIDYYHQSGSRPMVYGVGCKGGSFLSRELGLPNVRWGEKNRAVGRIFLEHTLLVSHVMVALELACRKTEHIRLLMNLQLPHQGKKISERRPFQWKVNIKRGVKCGVIPDRVFALETLDSSGKTNRLHFFLEADRGTMPVTRRNLSQTSFYRKLLTYQATWSQSLHRTEFGFNRFRVLTVTTRATRVDSLLKACSQLKRGHGLFLFSDQSSLSKSQDIFSSIWKTGSDGESVSLFN